MKSNRLGLAMILVGGFAGAQGSGALASRPAFIRTTGDGVVYAQPDEVQIDIGVVTHAGTAQAAGTGNAAATQAVLERLRREAGSKADIRTISYSLNPDYRFDNGKRSLNGYDAVNTVEVTSGDLADVGKLIDAATAGGANQIQRLEFNLKDEKTARAEALRKAAVEARSNAAAMASALGVRLGRVLSLEQSSAQPVRPVMPMVAAEAIRAAPTPVESGPLEVRASVTLTMALE